MLASAFGYGALEVARDGRVDANKLVELGRVLARVAGTLETFIFYVVTKVSPGPQFVAAPWTLE